MAICPWTLGCMIRPRFRSYDNSRRVISCSYSLSISRHFARDTTIMQNVNDRLSGRKPIEFIKHAAPVVILDEPQNMETEIARTAIESLNPLCTLRYSATHRNVYNLLYRLDPVKAYDLKLVKRIEVDAVLDSSEFNKPYIAVKSIKATRSKITAKLEIDLERAGRVRRVARSVSKQGTNLYELSGRRA